MDVIHLNRVSNYYPRRGFQGHSTIDQICDGWLQHAYIFSYDQTRSSKTDTMVWYNPTASVSYLLQFQILSRVYLGDQHGSICHIWHESGSIRLVN